MRGHSGGDRYFHVERDPRGIRYLTGDALTYQRNQRKRVERDKFTDYAPKARYRRGDA